MEILYLLIPLSVLIVFLIAVAFWWSLKSGQFDDLEGPGYRVLMDDDKVQQKAATAAQQKAAKAAQQQPANAARDDAKNPGADGAQGE